MTGKGITYTRLHLGSNSKLDTILKIKKLYSTCIDLKFDSTHALITTGSIRGLFINEAWQKNPYNCPAVL